MKTITTGLPRVALDQQPLGVRPKPCGATHGGRHDGCVALAARVALVAATLPPVHAADRPVFFAAPYTGKKIATYEVELPVSRQARRTFAVPADCAEVARSAAANAAQWGTRTEQSVWRKVGSDCRYYTFLHRYSTDSNRDFVSGYDFMNAYLRDLPIRARCRNPPGRVADPACKPLPPGVPDLSRLLAFLDRGLDSPRLDVRPCRLENGIFRGRVIYDRSGIHCEADPTAPGFRVIAADYADVNGDRVLDVVLRLVSLAPGASRMPLTLPLTRESPDGVFTIPEEVRVP